MNSISVSLHSRPAQDRVLKALPQMGGILEQQRRPARRHHRRGLYSKIRARRITCTSARANRVV